MQMLSPRWRKMLRDVWLHKSRSALVVIAVASGMLGAGALLDAWSLVQRVTVETYQASHPVSATLRVDVLDSALLAQVRAMPAIAAARARRVVSATARIGGAPLTAELFALDDFNTQGIGKLGSEHGKWPPRDGEIAIEKSSLAFSGLEISGTTPAETVTVQIGKNPAHALTLTSVAHDVSLPPGWMDHVVYGFVTPATLAMLGAPSSLNEIQVVVRDATADRDAVRRTAYDVKALIEREGGHVTNIDVPVPGQHAHAAQMNSLVLTQGAFGLLTLLVCSFLIVNLITAILSSQTREISVMKAIGAHAGQIAAMYLGFALVLGVLASAIALPVAIAIGRAYAGMNAEMLNFTVAGYAIPWWAIAIQIAVGCLLPVAAAAIPIARACAMPVNAGLRDPGIATGAGGLHVRRRMIAIPGIARPLQLSIGNAFRKRQRMLLTLLVLAAGGAVYLGADDLRSAVRGSVDLMFSSQRYDVVLRLATTHDPRQIEVAAARVAGVKRMEVWNSGSATVVHADRMQGNAFAVVGLPVGSSMVVPAMQRGRWLNATDRNVLVVSRLLLKDEPGLAPGSDVTLTINGKSQAFHVVGSVDAGPQSLAYMPRVALDVLHGDDYAANLVVATDARNPDAQLDVIVRLRAALEDAGMPVASSQSLGEARSAIEDHLLMVVAFLGVMSWVMIAIGGMGLAATMSIAVLERTREIGVLRAIGARHRTIMTMIQVEGLVIAALGWMVSIPLSIPMSWVLADAFGKIMLPTPARLIPDARSLLGWLAMVVVVSLIASALPARRAIRIPTATALSYE
jgi:putative ABC transport system permease protein